MNNDQAKDDGPRDCFQVFAERKYMPSARGYQNFRGSFDSASSAMAFAEKLFEDQSYYTGYEWVQVADVVSGQLWDFFETGKTGHEWVTNYAESNAGDE